ncbi:hypothetical protein Tco_0771553 [Tanacetum coccineum]|uniref:Uncharacterized protein n=1 Tax=Tanacetum coccineum TaxID=301880 RepID=A0ABQ4ZIY4_9ASTR
MIVSNPMIFSSANSTEYLVSMIDGTMSLKGLNSVDVRLLSDRFYILVIIASFALTSYSLEVSLERESHDLHNSNSLKVLQKVNGESERKCFRCGDPNHFISDSLKRPHKDQKAFVGGSWSDSEEEEELKKDKICLMAHESNNVHSDYLYYSNSSLDDETL